MNPRSCTGLLLVLLVGLTACRNDMTRADPCERSDVGPLCNALRNSVEIEAFIYPDPDGEELDAEAIETFVAQVHEAVTPERVVEVSIVTGRVLARLDAASLRLAAEIPSARMALNQFTPLPQPAQSPRPEKSD